VSDRQRQSFNPPRLPPGWQPSTQALPLVPVSKKKVGHVATDKPRKLPSRRQFHDRQTLHVSIRDDPDAIINHIPDVARGETLLWLLSRNGGCKQVVDMAKQKYAKAKAEARSGELVVSERNIRSTLSHRKKTALTARAEHKGTSYEKKSILILSMRSTTLRFQIHGNSAMIREGKSPILTKPRKMNIITEKMSSPMRIALSIQRQVPRTFRIHRMP